MTPPSASPIRSLRSGFLHLLPALGLLLATAPLPVAAQAAKKPALEITVGANNTLVIPRSALGKEHLMSASRIPQTVAATSTGLSGRVVRFELFHDGVDLYEATDGLVVTKDLPARRLLTTFPIVEQDGNKVVIDFNRGMRRLYTEMWIGGRNFNSSARDESLEIPQSRVFLAEKNGDQLTIRQSVQVRDRESQSNLEQQFEVRYFFTPYSAGTYKGKEAPASDLRYSKFFESQARLEETTGRPSPQMARFDISKPVVFHFSANTPAEYVEAVKDGILYWNRAFGTNVVRAEKAPEGVTAPDPRYNIVQWVPWDSAGFAYADILLDPRSGESQHGQAFMTSVFGISGKSRARTLLRAMREMAGDKKSSTIPGSQGEAAQGFPWMTANGLCQIQAPEFALQYAQGLEDLLSKEGLTDEATLRTSQDYVRQVVAHEVGHVLGLRHNFAGSVAATLNRQELDEWFQSYVTNGVLDSYTNRYATSSIMEYPVFKSSVQAGWIIRTQKSPLPHDRAAIQWGYLGGSEPRDKKMLFGTDDQVGVWGDLQRFDFGVEPVIGAYGQLAEDIRLLPNSLVETFIGAKAPRDPRDAVPVAEVNLSPDRAAARLAASFADMLGWFRAGARSIRIENQFDFIGELNEKDRAKAHWKDLNDQFERLGGVDRALFAFLPLDLKLELKDAPKGVTIAEKVSASALQARLKKLLETPAYTNFVGLDEKKYAFTPEEKEIILKRGEKYFAELETELVKQVCQRLENAPRDLALTANETLEDADITAKLEQRIADVAKLVLTAKDESRRIKGKVDKGFVEVVEFRYDSPTRLAAAKMLNDKTGSYRGWSVDTKGDLNKVLKDEVEGALNIANFKEFKEAMLSRTLREWYLRQQDVLQLLPPKPGK